MGRKDTKPVPYHDYIFIKDRLPIKLTNCNVSYFNKSGNLKTRHNQNVSGYLFRDELENVKYEELIDLIIFGDIKVRGLFTGTVLTNETKVIFTKENPFK